MSTARGVGIGADANSMHKALPLEILYYLNRLHLL